MIARIWSARAGVPLLARISSESYSALLSNVVIARSAATWQSPGTQALRFIPIRSYEPNFGRHGGTATTGCWIGSGVSAGPLGFIKFIGEMVSGDCFASLAMTRVKGLGIRKDPKDSRCSLSSLSAVWP
jgi:hypothetical protein